jgi:hypothetical protein
MPTSPDTLIGNAESRARTATVAADNALQTVIELLSVAGDPINLPAGVRTNGFDPYVAPERLQTTDPVYEPPQTPIPEAPELDAIGAIDAPPDRNEPDIDIAGLFNHDAPSGVIPVFDEAEPDLRIDELVAELDALGTPDLSMIEIPSLTDILIPTAPGLDLPAFYELPLPDTLRDPDDYAAAFDDKYRQMAPEIQAFVDDKVTDWIATYAPEYSSWVAAMQTKVLEGLEGGILPDQFEAAMYTRAQERVEREFDAAQTAITEAYARSGFMEPPGAVMAGRHLARLKSGDALANQATDIYIERRKTEVQHIQLVMQLASAQINGVRSVGVQYAQSVGANLATTVNYATSFADKLAKIYDHLIGRAQLQIAILGALNAQFETKLKAALSAREGYKLELEGLKLVAEVDSLRINGVKLLLGAEELKIQRFSALIDAIVKKGSLEELKLKGYDIRSRVFDTQVKAMLASFEAYKALMSGDQGKLEGELAKLKAFDLQLQGDNLKLEGQSKNIAAIAAANDAKARIFGLQADAHKTDASVALTKFTAQAEMRKLAQAVYGQELGNSIEVFKAGAQLSAMRNEAAIRQYSAEAEAIIKAAQLDIERLRIHEHASAALAAGYSSVAAASLGSLNSVASSVITSSQ